MAVLTASRNVSVLVASRTKQFLPREHTKKAPHWGAFFVCVLLTLLPFEQVSAQESACSRLPGGAYARVVHVYDGDTLKLADGRRIRLLGINTPELGRDGRKDQPFARSAAQWLELHTEGREVYWVQGLGKQDRYGRTLAHVYLPDGRLVAEGLAKEGLGHVLARGVGRNLESCLFKAEARAERAGKGVWQQGVRQASDIRQGGFALVKGRITRVTRTSSGTYMDLDNHLALFLPVELKAQGASGWHKGQLLQARGWIIDRQRRGQTQSSGRQRWLLKITHLRHLQRL